MRQAGIIAAPGLVALRTMIPRLREDHEHARLLAERLAAVPGLGYRRAAVVTQASTAASIVLPGGDVVGMGTQFAMLRGWGFDTHSASLAVLVTGIWNQLVRVAFPVVAVGLLAFVGDVNVTLTLPPPLVSRISASTVLVEL